MMLVMEAVEGEDFSIGLHARVSNRLQEVVCNLHRHGFVHGDLRANNICVAGERVCIIDFDWSGPAGEQRYPNFMNHLDITWPDGANDGELVLPAHDMEWLRRLDVLN
jgi:RIO-like serine/threonine protein kinase